MENVTIGRMQPDEIDAAATVLSHAFMATPNVRAMLGEPAEGKRLGLKTIFRGMLKRAHVDTIVTRQEGRTVGALVFPKWPHCQASLGEKLAMMPEMLSVFGLRAALRGARMRAAWGKRDPKRVHYHIDPLGVLPELQGRGIGPQMLRESAGSWMSKKPPRIWRPTHQKMCAFTKGLASGRGRRRSVRQSQLVHVAALRHWLARRRSGSQAEGRASR